MASGPRRGDPDSGSPPAAAGTPVGRYRRFSEAFAEAPVLSAIVRFQFFHPCCGGGLILEAVNVHPLDDRRTLSDAATSAQRASGHDSVPIAPIHDRRLSARSGCGKRETSLRER